MAWELQRERFWPLNDTYEGPVGVMEFEFTYFDNPTSLQAFLDISLFGNSIAPGLPDKYLSYTIEQDDDGGITDRFRIRVYLADEVERKSGSGIPSVYREVDGIPGFIALTTAITIIVGLSLLIVLGNLVWRLYNLTDSVFDFLEIDVRKVAIAGAIVLVALMFKK